MGLLVASSQYLSAWHLLLWNWILPRGRFSGGFTFLVPRQTLGIPLPFGFFMARPETWLSVHSTRLLSPHHRCWEKSPFLQRMTVAPLLTNSQEISTSRLSWKCCAAHCSPSDSVPFTLTFAPVSSSCCDPQCLFCATSSALGLLRIPESYNDELSRQCPPSLLFRDPSLRLSPATSLFAIVTYCAGER